MPKNDDDFVHVSGCISILENDFDYLKPFLILKRIIMLKCSIKLVYRSLDSVWKSDDLLF